MSKEKTGDILTKNLSHNPLIKAGAFKRLFIWCGGAIRDIHVMSRRKRQMCIGDPKHPDGMKPLGLCILLSTLLFISLGAFAQSDKRIEEQKRVIAAIEKRIANEEAQIAKLKKGRAANEERVRLLARQIDSRSQLIEANERRGRRLRGGGSWAARKNGGGRSG